MPDLGIYGRIPRLPSRRRNPRAVRGDRTGNWTPPSSGLLLGGRAGAQMTRAETKLALLRQRFATEEQFRAHLTSMEEHSLLFFRDPGLALPIGAEALLEIALDDSENTYSVRASALARAEGHGVWLAMPAARFAREARGAGIVQRAGRRLGAERIIRLRRPSGSECLAVLADVSIGGGRLSGGLPYGLSRHDEVEIRLASPQMGEPLDPICARVAWCEGGEAGIEIDRRKPASRAAATKLFELLLTQWRSAREVRHLDLCCRDGKLLDPPAPRLRIDGKRISTQG